MADCEHLLKPYLLNAGDILGWVNVCPMCGQWTNPDTGALIEPGSPQRAAQVRRTADPGFAMTGETERLVDEFLEAFATYRRKRTQSAFEAVLRTAERCRKAIPWFAYTEERLRSEPHYRIEDVTA